MNKYKQIIKQQNKEYYEKNKEKCIQISKEWNLMNPDKTYQYKKKYYQTHYEIIKGKRRQEKNRGKQRLYQIKYREAHKKPPKPKQPKPPKKPKQPKPPKKKIKKSSTNYLVDDKFVIHFD